MNKDHVFILGAGGHTRSLINIINNYHVRGILDESYNKNTPESIANIPIVADLSDLQDFENIVISSGNPAIREKWFSFLQDQLLQDNLLHQSSIIENRVIIGCYNQIMALVYINSEVRIGNNNLINTSSIIEHEVEIGNHNHISIGVKLGGRSMIGDCCFIGAGAVIVDKVHVTDKVIIGANSLVISDINEPGTYVGSPVKKIK